MKAVVTFEITVVVTVPDELPEQVRQLARDEGENYVDVDWTDQQIIERIAFIRGVRTIRHDESMTPEMNAQVNVRIEDESVADYVVLP